MKTLEQAIKLALVGSKHIYACGESYVEPVRLPAGVSLFGGFDCENGWKYVGLARRAKITPGPGSVALVFLEGEGKSLAGDLEVRSADAEGAGESSIAALVQDAATGSLVRTDLHAGNGADGADGENGGHAGGAKDGLPGVNGTDACTSNPGLGGSAIELNCGDGTMSVSGPGGDGGEMVATNGGDGLPMPEPNPASFGLGGKGEAVAPKCTGGTNGDQGEPGADGVPATAAEGRITKEGAVIGRDGGDGEPGRPGQGGGGGGASFGNALVCGAAPHGGAGGGSGGTGGCGGRGGRGGQAGGSSLGLVVRGPNFTFADIRITVGKGGRGGNGASPNPEDRAVYPARADKHQVEWEGSSPVVVVVSAATAATADTGPVDTAATRSTWQW